jgi:hypothetical protein
VNSSSTWLRLACSLLASEGRIGSTRPMPMNEMTHANATAQTARGWRNGLGAAALWGGPACAGTRAFGGVVMAQLYREFI